MGAWGQVFNLDIGYLFNISLHHGKTAKIVSRDSDHFIDKIEYILCSECSGHPHHILTPVKKWKQQSKMIKYSEAEKYL